MKIQIERKPKFFPDRAKCVACRQIFPVQSLLNLLYSDRGLLQGELCPGCAKSNSAIIQAKIKEQAWSLLQNSQLLKSDSISIGEKVCEILVTSQETVKFPSFWQLWRKKLAIWRVESAELQQARFGLTKGYCHKRQQLKYLLEDRET
jgi:hypothetical protein